jgi:hypothetical protein
MTPAPAPVTLACLDAAVTLISRAASAAAHCHSAARLRAGDMSESCDTGLVTRRWIHADRTSPRRCYSITDPAAGSWLRSGRSGLAFTAAVGRVLGGGSDPGGGPRPALMAQEKP